MKEYISFKKYYKDTITDYHKLSQEEVVELYIKDKEEKEEKFKNSTYNLLREEKEEQIKAVEEELKVLKETLNNDYLSIFNQDRKKEIKEQIEIKNLELQFLKIRANYYEVPKLNYLMTASSLNSLTKGNKRLRTFPSRETRNKIVNGNLDLAFYLASKYYHKQENELPLDDLVQIANRALISAAAYYVPSNRATFRTYARKCIENQLKTAVFDRKKKKKPVHKPKTFFEDERAKITYVKMFLENYKLESKSGNKYYSVEREIPTSLLLYRFREEIRGYNKDKKIRCENNKMYPSFSRPRNDGALIMQYNKILYRIRSILKTSKISVLITEEDRMLASLYNNYKNVLPSLETINELIYIIDCYLTKLDLVEEYLKAEKDFTLINEGIAPNDDEILQQINSNINAFNNERRRYIKTELKDVKEKYYSSYWDIPDYKRFDNYYSIYKELYNVDFLLTEYSWNKEDLKSRQDEIEEIEDDFEYEVDSAIEEITNLITEITISSCTKIYLKPSKNIFQLYEWIEYPEENPNDVDIYTKEEAIKILEERIEQLNSMDEEEYVSMVLEERKNNALKLLNETNEPIIKHNKEIAQVDDRRNYYKNPKKKRKEHELKQASEAVQLLYMDDEDLFFLMNNQNRKDRYHHTVDIPVEDEVCSNLFLHDYYEALEELPSLEKEVLIRYYDQDGRHSTKAKDIAEELNITEKKVYALKDRGLSRLRKNKKMQSYLEY